MSDDALHLKKNGRNVWKNQIKNWCAPGYIDYYYKCKENTFYRLPRKDLQRKNWLQMRKLVCPPAAGSATDHFPDADYKTKDVRDKRRQTVSVNYVILGQRHCRSSFPHMTMHQQLFFVPNQRTERCVESDEPKPG